METLQASEPREKYLTSVLDTEQKLFETASKIREKYSVFKVFVRRQVGEASI